MFEKGSIVYVLPGFQYASKTSFREKTHTHTLTQRKQKKTLPYDGVLKVIISCRTHWTSAVKSQGN